MAVCYLVILLSIEHLGIACCCGESWCVGDTSIDHIIGVLVIYLAS